MSVLKPRVLLHFYRRRLRVHWMQELLAAIGIATGVALVFGVQVANTSITGSAQQIVEGITGRATLQLAARDTTGFDAGMLERVERVPGVDNAAALLEQRITIRRGSKIVSVDLVGVDRELPSLGGVAARNFQLGGLVLQPGILLPSAMGEVLGLPSPTTGSEMPVVSLGVRGRALPSTVNAVLGSETIGPLSGAMMAVASIGYVQRLADMPGRVTRVLVQPRPGQEEHVRAQLTTLAQGRLTVASVDTEARLLEQATGPIDQSTGLFAAISAFVGVLFVFNAMLLTVPERRRFIADMRILGYRPGHIVQILGFQAVALGLFASLAGLLVGYLLSRTAAQNPPGYLALAFPLGIQPVISPFTVALAVFGGVIATCLAATQPLFDLRRGRDVDAVFSEDGEPGHALTDSTRRWMAVSAVALVAATTLLAIVAPSLTVVGVAGLAVATVLAVPTAFAVMLRVAEPVARRGNLNMLLLAVRALRATTVRSLALAATGAVAVFGTVTIEGAHENLLNGLYEDYAEYAGTADVWIANPDDDLALQPFDARDLPARIAATAGVRQVRQYNGGLLDVADRRAWVIARPNADRTMIPPSQIIEGDLATATTRLRAGGWITVSQQIADAEHVDPGDEFALPTPSGEVRYRVAATTTNLGWGPGAIIMNQGDYRRHWPTEGPTALEVDLTAGTNPAAATASIQQAIGRGTSLDVQTTSVRSEHANALAREGLARLSQISTLLLVAAALAMAAAMGAGIWQRRAAFAQLRIEGFRSSKLWRALLIEAGLVLGTGCITGAIAGTYGHFLGNRWLQISTGYPAPFSFTLSQSILTCVLVAAAALVVTAVPGFLVSRTPARVGLDAP